VSGICIGLAFGVIHAVIPADRFTLAWDHTVEKVRWEEDYRRVRGGLELTAAHIRGQGAGMEVPPGAVWRGGAWHYRPDLPVLPRLSLARAARYALCRDGSCTPLEELLPAGAGDERVDIFPCPAPPDGPDRN
jgi:hypothetical protein